MAALVLAGFPTTKTLMLFLATWSMAVPWTWSQGFVQIKAGALINTAEWQ